MFPPENAAGNFVKVVQRIPVKIVFNSQPNEKYNFSVGMSVVAEIKIN
jgi:membrane fusion protein (multidrug efflux system)